jgi:hypothetical protein
MIMRLQGPTYYSKAEIYSSRPRKHRELAKNPDISAEELIQKIDYNEQRGNSESSFSH